MASWKLFWISLVLIVAPVLLMGAVNDARADTIPRGVAGSILLIFWGGALITWFFACRALGDERFTRGTLKKVVAVLLSFMFPIIFISLFFLIPNRSHTARA